VEGRSEATEFMVPAMKHHPHIDYAPGFFTELVRRYHFPPMFAPQPVPQISDALKAQRSQNLAKGRVQKGKSI
jgi:hypothetical protein